MLLPESAVVDLARNPHGDVVVCLDDEPEILSALRREFRYEPFDVLTTVSPDQALQWVDSFDVGVVLSDQRMPEMQGTDFLVEVRRRSPLTRRVMLTGFPWTTLREPEAIDGIQGLVCKPWGADSLRKMVRRLLRERGQDGRSA